MEEGEQQLLVQRLWWDSGPRGRSACSELRHGGGIRGSGDWRKREMWRAVYASFSKSFEELGKAQGSSGDST
jgi:hypothetical protein